MKTLFAKSDSSGPADKKMKLSQSEVQRLIEQEVQTALKKKENKLLGLLGTIQELDESLNYKSSIQKLEERINTVTKRAEAAIAFMTQKESPGPSLNDVNLKRADTVGKKMEIPTVDKKGIESMEANEELLNMMKSTKRALTKMQEDNESLKVAIADLREELPFPSTNGSPASEGTQILIKKEPDHVVEKIKVEETKQCEEPTAKRVKAESLSPDHSSRPKQTDTKQDTLSYPPLPLKPFPPVLSMEVASYNIPGRPKVDLAFIKNPATLSVLWDVEDKGQPAPPMDRYCLFITTENVKGSGVFPSWTALGEVAAIPLPMCVMLSKYKPGHKVCVAVIGKDKFGRYGPYSKVVSKAIPE
ncbi:activating transcription factor 7-interacting protein 2 [Eleginops maclovinus]